MDSTILNDSDEYILNTSREYAIYVCDQRAIPQVTDGLKSSQRKMLWLMRNRNDKIKTISLAGEAISSGLYLHGDNSASQTISLMAAPFCNNVPLLNGIGSFGSAINPTAWGAPRYTYVKKNKLVDAFLFRDINIVPLKENYDGSTMEPVTFLPIIPVVLLNGISGIAVGWSTEILPRTITSLIDAVVKILDKNTVESLPPSLNYIENIITNIENNTWEFRGKFNRLDSNTIEITNLPFGTDFEKFKERLIDLEDNNHIVEFIDNSSEKISIIIKFKRAQLKQMDDIDIVNLLKLKSRKTERITVLDFNFKSIKTYDSPVQLLKDWVEWRLGYYIKRYENLLKIAKNDLEYYYSIEKCFNNNIMENLIQKENKKQIVDFILSVIKNDTNISNIIAEKIASTPIYFWNKENRAHNLNNIENTKQKINLYNSYLNDHNKIVEIFKTEVDDLRKIKNT